MYFFRKQDKKGGTGMQSQTRICVGVALLVFAITSSSSIMAQERGMAAEGPATIILDSIAEYYEPVEFDHATHIEFAENDCAKCHHHTIGTPSTGTGNCILCHKHEATTKIVACRGCHFADPYSEAAKRINAERGEVFHRDKPSLKGAYHQFCISCHEEVDGPYTCDGCHPRNDKGDKFFHSGKYAPKNSGNHEESEH